jgi:hypothetical protein
MISLRAQYSRENRPCPLSAKKGAARLPLL